MGKQIGFLAEKGTVLVTTGWDLEGGTALVSTGWTVEASKELRRMAEGSWMHLWQEQTLNRTENPSGFAGHLVLSFILTTCSSQGKYCASQTWKSKPGNFFNCMFLWAATCSVSCRASSALVPSKIKIVHKQHNLFFLLSFVFLKFFLLPFIHSFSYEVWSNTLKILILSLKYA